MNISSAVREYAVMQILGEFRATWSGAQVQLQDLGEAWPNTGLREQDLELALTELIGSGFFTGLPASPEDPLVVSDLGAEMLTRNPLRLFSMDEFLRVQGVLNRARRRQSGMPQVRGRPALERRGAQHRGS